MTITEQARLRPAGLGALLLEGDAMIARLARAHAGWGLTAGTPWVLDQPAGLIIWTLPGRVATAPVQILGTYHAPGATWQWAWANRTILPALTHDSRVVCEWAAHHGHDHLAAPELRAADDIVATVAALAVRVTGATGFFRGTGGPLVPFATFGPVTFGDPG
jgi:hypothetical protein